jgi:alkanal monooxygenase alpha chain
VKWGVMLSTAKPERLSHRDVFEAAIEYALAAERHGYDCAWLLEHHFTPYGLCPNTINMASFILGRTTTLHVGTAVVVAPLTHPVRLAEDAALIDQLSGGRFSLGLGRGSFPRDFQVFGADPSRSHEALYECVDVIQRAWTQERVSSDGPLHPFPEVPVYPKPCSKLGPEIRVAATSSATVEWAAARAIPMIISSTLDDEETITRMELYNEIAEMNGHDPASVDHVMIVLGYVADSRREAQDAIIDDLSWWADESIEVSFQVSDLKKLPNYGFHYRNVEQAALRGEYTAEHMIRKGFDANPVGTPEQCAARLEEMIAMTGIHNVVIAIEGAQKKDAILRNIERFATEVFPAVRLNVPG